MASFGTINTNTNSNGLPSAPADNTAVSRGGSDLYGSSPSVSSNTNLSGAPNFGSSAPQGGGFNNAGLINLSGPAQQPSATSNGIGQQYVNNGPVTASTPGAMFDYNTGIWSVPGQNQSANLSGTVNNASSFPGQTPGYSSTLDSYNLSTTPLAGAGAGASTGAPAQNPAASTGTTSGGTSPGGYTNTNPNPQGNLASTNLGSPYNLSSAGLPNTTPDYTNSVVPGTGTSQLLGNIGQQELNTLSTQQPGSYFASMPFLQQQANEVGQSLAAAPWLSSLPGYNGMSNTEATAAQFNAMDPSEAVNLQQYLGPHTPANAPFQAFMGSNYQPPAYATMPTVDASSPTGISNGWPSPGPGQTQYAPPPSGGTNTAPNSNGVVTTPLGYTQYGGSPQTQSSGGGNTTLQALAQLLLGGGSQPQQSQSSGGNNEMMNALVLALLAGRNPQYGLNQASLGGL